MGRKNQFEPQGLQKLIQTHLPDLSISWTHDSPQPDHPTFLQFTESLDDIPEILKSQEVNFWDRYDNYSIIASVKLVTEQRLCFIVDETYRELYLALTNTWPGFWYPIKSKKQLVPQLVDLIGIYQGESHHSNRFHVFLGSQQNGFQFLELWGRLLTHRCSDQLVYGSAWKDYPFRNLKVQRAELIQPHAQRQDIHQHPSFSAQTKLSQSRITFHNHNGIFTLEISYPRTKHPLVQMIGEVLNKSFPDDLPLDVLVFILELPWTSWRDVLTRQRLTPRDVFLLHLLTDSPLDKEDLISTMSERIQQLEYLIESNKTNKKLIKKTNHQIGMLQKLLKQGFVPDPIMEEVHSTHLSSQGLVPTTTSSSARSVLPNSEDLQQQIQKRIHCLALGESVNYRPKGISESNSPNSE